MSVTDVLGIDRERADAAVLVAVQESEDFEAMDPERLAVCRRFLAWASRQPEPDRFRICRLLRYFGDGDSSRCWSDWENLDGSAAQGQPTVGGEVRHGPR